MEITSVNTYHREGEEQHATIDLKMPKEELWKILKYLEEFKEKKE